MGGSGVTVVVVVVVEVAAEVGGGMSKAEEAVGGGMAAAAEEEEVGRVIIVGKKGILQGIVPMNKTDKCGYCVLSSFFFNDCHLLITCALDLV